MLSCLRGTDWVRGDPWAMVLYAHPSCASLGSLVLADLGAQEAGGDQKRGKKEPGASRRLAGKVGTARQPGGGGEPRPFCTFALEVGLRQACFFWVLVKKPHRSVMESECEG